MMDIRVYQINLDRDENGIAFESLDTMRKWQKSSEVDSAIYDKVFEGTVEANDLEDVFAIFNLEQPDGYSGRSMSVSDIVEICRADNEKSSFYYCDSIGFKPVDFDPAKTQEAIRQKITVVMVEPGKRARIAEIGTSLEDLQKAVGGMIETYYPFEEEVCIVCNDEGKLIGMPPCRAIYGEDKKVMDIICGPFFICDCRTESFASLSQEQLKRYTEQFRNPEHFFKIGSEITAVPDEPRQTGLER